MKRCLCFFLLLVLVAAASRAEVTKVFVVEKPELGQGEKVSDWNQDKVMLRPPTDEEMSLLGKMLKNDVTSVHELKFHIFQGMLRERWIFIDKTPEDPPVDEEAQVRKATDRESAILEDALNKSTWFFHNWSLRAGLGLNLPLNSEFAQTYQPTGGVNVAVGLNFSPSVELSLDFDYTHFNSANDSLTGGYYMSQMDLALLFKYRFLTEDVRPYLFAGPGMGGHYFVWDYRIGNLYASETVRDTVCFMAEAGAGLEIKIRKGLLFYVQGKMSTDFSGSDLNGFIPVGSPIQYVPLQAGIILGN